MLKTLKKPFDIKLGGEPMKSIWLVGFLVCLFFSSTLFAIAECPENEYSVRLNDCWCCPNHAAWLACMELLDKSSGEKLCYNLGCYPDHLERIKREIEEKEKRKQKPSDCSDCEKFVKGRCENCYEIGMHCLHGKCLTDEEYRRQSAFSIRQEIVRQREIYNEGKGRQEEFDRQHPVPTPQPREEDREQFLPPPTRPDRDSGRLVVRPCGSGIWSCGVCCCPDQAHCKRLPGRLNPRGYGPLPSPDTLWDECRSYGCWAPPHSYE